MREAKRRGNLNTMIISLTGFMGCGKSSVGRKLSELLCCPFMDLDDVIVESAGRSIPEIFATEGEAAFRHMELEALKTIASSHEDEKHQSEKSEDACTTPALVLALGGGTVMTKECAEIVREDTYCVYLKASIETLMEHLSGEADGRPMLQGATALPEPDMASRGSDMASRGSDTSLQGSDMASRGSDMASRRSEQSGNPLYERITELMAQRSETYEKTAHIIIDTDGKSIEAIASEILSLSELDSSVEKSVKSDRGVTKNHQN